MTDRELLEKIRGALAPLDAKIDHALFDGSPEQMRADLSYIRGLVGQICVACEEVTREQHE